MRHNAMVLGVLLVLVACPALADTITVSGHITDPGGVGESVPGLHIYTFSTDLPAKYVDV